MTPLAEEEVAILAHVVIDPTAWVENALIVVGEPAIREKIEKYRPYYLAEKDLPGYMTRAEIESSLLIPATLSEIITRALLGIDVDTDAIYGAVLGNRGPEYLDAEVAAQAYKDALYTGTVPEDVQSYATAMGWTAQQAADDILATAAAWRPAKHAIRANRLAAKEAVRDSLTIGEVEAVLAWWAVFVVAIRAQLGV